MLRKISTSITPLIDETTNPPIHTWDEIESIISNWFEKNNIHFEIKSQLRILDAHKFYDTLPINDLVNAIKQDIKNTYHQDWNLRLSKKNKNVVEHTFEIPIKAKAPPESFNLYNVKTGEKIPTIKEIKNESTILTIPNYEKINGTTATAKISCIGDAIAQITVDKKNITGVCVRPVKDMKADKKES